MLDSWHYPLSLLLLLFHVWALEPFQMGPSREMEILLMDTGNKSFIGRPQVIQSKVKANLFI